MRAIDVTRVRIGPAEEGMCFAGGADRDRAPIQLDGATEVSAAMSGLKDFRSRIEGLRTLTLDAIRSQTKKSQPAAEG